MRVFPLDGTGHIHPVPEHGMFLARLHTSPCPSTGTNRREEEQMCKIVNAFKGNGAIQKFESYPLLDDQARGTAAADGH